MGFHLVRIDCDIPYKIKLDPGNHVFGRGTFLKVNDKRISRQHGQFEVTDDSLIITALHQNPCFYQKSGTTQAQTLKQSGSISLSSGDKLGLLPTTYWYEVVKLLMLEKEDDNNTQKDSEETIVDSGEETDNDGESRLKSDSAANEVPDTDNIGSQSTEIMSSSRSDQQTTNEDSDNDINSDQAGSVLGKSSVDSKLTADADSDRCNTDKPQSPSLISEDKEEQSNYSGPSASEQSSVLQKRPHSTSEDGHTDEVKKVKTEQEDNPVKPDSDAQQAGSSNPNNVDVKPPQPAPAPLRERCMYGASCYRRNPVHRAQFSHPSDADWGAGPTAPCPWGAACGKRDPRHWRDHHHPPGKDQPPPQPGRKKRRRRSGTPPDFPIVTGKRVRKTVHRDNWSVSDDSDSDPYRTDESDEWQPSSDYTESQP